ncbi:PBP1A family penicillin-binding protein [Brachyspira aalborgi]|uniref:peptidoglycan glycosyltransferase n=1 Tax=Brachyspira aalborgi TaxID=29522 RepID=A0AB38Q0W7_9SPIR|nr:PBP1A family penicillin-binding protein [Brachyspira aalborgi]TXJ14104.1 PBP1A family penicillin-binding protein [Brachyspira aalborgi]TXJ18801.1 PBP1A family penicillin-binding protein [Brachyspira aalborgi]TXJ25563.1 PBP1A family penicillin-binding protein [Brachyspira aalborgi]TXJ46893.1 PBP1A family penicillin-binding protein [Brachyspira aalborgi]
MKFLKNIWQKYNNLDIKQFKKFYIIAIAIIFLLNTIIFSFLIADIVAQPDIEAIELYQPTIPTKIYDIKGEVISEFFTEQRALVNYKDLPPHLIEAIISMEDNNFMKHAGIDIIGIFRGTIGNMLLGRRPRGASTLTQQVARGIVLKSRERTITRKLREIWVTFQIEKRLTKEEIVTLYFNQIFFGHSVYGVQAASRFYFNKDVQDLNLAECAMLATLPPSPNTYSPINNPNISMQRHKVVLKRMNDMKFITQAEGDIAYKEFWESYTGKIGRRGTTAYSASMDRAPYVTEYVRRILVERYDEKTLKEEGLKIYTTIDIEKQEAAQKLLTEALRNYNIKYEGGSLDISSVYDRTLLNKLEMLSLIVALPEDLAYNKFNIAVRDALNKNVSSPLALLSDMFGMENVNDVIMEVMKADEAELSRQIEGALVSINPKNGYIVSMVGGSGFTPRNQLNRVTQARRQAGSAFKPFVYAASMDITNYSPSTIVSDAPIGFVFEDGNSWIPKNYSANFKGDVSLRYALAVSLNIATINVLNYVGVTNAIKYMEPIFKADNDEKKSKRMFNADLTLSLGTGLFTPLELTTGFAAIANEGKEVEPILIRYVTDRHDVMIDNFEEDLKKEIEERGGAKQVMSQEVAYLISDILSGVLRGGTATSAMYEAKFTRMGAGKTGTSNDWKDAWFVGYTPELATGIWIGFDSFKYSLGNNQVGGRIAAPIWGKYMVEALKTIKPTWYKKPNNIVNVNICAVSGKLPSASCYSIKSELFIRDKIPNEICNVCANYLQDSSELDSIIDSFLDY